ncbi:MAG: hypothetical protein ACRBN8_33565 [Nannocystales bacterium]
MSRASLTLLVSLSLGLGLTACGDDSSPGGGETDTDAATGDTTGGPTSDGPTSDGPTTVTPTGSTGTTDATDPDTGSETTDPTVGETEGDTETTGPSADATYIRIDALAVRDPHVFSPLPPNDDLTESTVNGPLTAALNADDDDDGNLDLGLAVAFLPLDQTDAATEVFRFANAVCTAPADASSCSLLADTIPFDGMYTVTEDGECYAAEAGNLSDYADPPEAPTSTAGPCFRSDIGTVTIAAGSFTLPLENAVVAAQFSGDPADGLVEGNIQGFVSIATAESIQVETGMAFPPTIQLSALLREEDQDEGGTGWVFHIAFSGTAADWTE